MLRLSSIFSSKWFFILLIAFAFLCGLIAGPWQILPHDLIHQLKENIISSTRKPTYKESEAAIREMKQNVIDACRLQSSNTIYSFFVAGHVYGNPDQIENVREGLYHPFVKKFNTINECKSMTFGFLLGDIVRESSNRSFEFAKRDLQLISSKIVKHIVPGNHDVGMGKNNSKRDIFIQNFGKTFKHFEYHNDLFILLDTNIDQWNILNDQLKILENFSKDDKNYNNVFIFTHQPIWYDKKKVSFSRVVPNSWEGYSEGTNFWDELFPIISNIGQKIYLFAGDVGAFPNESEFFYAKHANAHFFATGMGGGERDNFLIISIMNGAVNVALIPLNTSSSF